MVSLLVFSFFATSQTTKSQTNQRTVLPGHLPTVIPGLQLIARMDGLIQLKLSLHLPLHNRDALTSLLDNLYDSTSPLYHNYLTPDEFDARFGPTEAEYQTVVDFAVRHGFIITARHSNRLLLEVSAPVSKIESAFQLRMQTYRHPTESRTFYCPDTEPSVERGVSISYVGGLDSFTQPHPQNLRRSPLQPATKRSHQNIGSGPNGTLAGFDYRAAYVPGTALTGNGQSIGLVEFDGYYPGDITAYETQTAVTNVPLQMVLLDGFNGVPTTGSNSANSEVALDIEMAISMAPGLSNVVVFEDDPNTGQFNNVLQAMSANTSIKQFSCSWSFSSIPSAQRTSMDGYFLKMAVQGQSFFAADGDTGAAIGAIDPPDDDPYITIVGGTTLATAGPRGAWLSETVWNAQEGPGVAVTGGGISTIYNIPVWQKGLNLLANHGSNTKRNTPDVAMVADNIFIVADNGFQELSGGTSAAAPLWAAFAALANQQAVGAGLGPIGFVNPALYNIGTNSSFTACFDDVTVGNNTNNNASQFFAVPGYDLCTGWGSPSGSSLIIALTQPDGFEIQPGRGLVANGPVGGPFTASTQTLSLTNAGKSVFSWSAGSTSTWLHVSNSTSTLTAGGGAATVTLTLNPSANLLPAGVYTANVWFTNLTSGLVQIRQFTLQVNLEMVQDGSYEAGDFCYWNLAGDPSVYSYNFVDDGTYSSYSPVSGNYFAALGQPATLAYLSQPLVTRAGQLYLLSLWLENPSGATPNQFQIQWNTNVTAANVVFNQTNMGTFGYTNLLFVLQAATNTTTLQFGFRNDNDYFALDNVSVVPVPAPMFQTPVPIPGAIELTWAALPGLQYQLQYKPNLTQTNWIDLGIPITASNNSVSTTDLLSSDQQRFYRVQLVP